MADTTLPGSISFKAYKPETYVRKKEFSAVNTWMYKMDQYLTIIQQGIPTIPNIG